MTFYLDVGKWVGWMNMTNKEVLEKVLENCKDKQEIKEALVLPYPEIYKFGQNCESGRVALEELKFQVGNVAYYTHDLQDTTFKVRDSGLFEVIEKDLEVLEILKPIIKASIVMSDHGINNSKLALDIKANKILKEWLENEQKRS